MNLKLGTPDKLRQIYDREKIEPETLKSLEEQFLSDYRNHLDNALTVSIGEQEGTSAIFLKDRFEDICRQIVPDLSKADFLAQKYQNLYSRASKAIYILAALAVIIISAQFIFNLPHQMIGLEILAMVAVLLIIRYGNQVGWHRRWLDYRLLAERLRFEVFSSFLSDNLALNETDYLHCRATKTSWSVCLFDEIKQKVDLNSELSPEHLGCLKSFLKIAWIEDQKNYHTRKIVIERGKHKSISTCGEVFYGLTLLAAVLHFFHVGNEFVSRVWTFLAIAFPAIGSAFSALRAHFEYKKNADRSERMAEWLQELYDQIDHVKDLDELSKMVAKAEALMLQENADWHITMHIHHLETPA